MPVVCVPVATPQPKNPSNNTSLSHKRLAFGLQPHVPWHKCYSQTVGFSQTSHGSYQSEYVRIIINYLQVFYLPFLWAGFLHPFSLVVQLQLVFVKVCPHHTSRLCNLNWLQIELNTIKNAINGNHSDLADFKRQGAVTW